MHRMKELAFSGWRSHLLCCVVAMLMTVDMASARHFSYGHMSWAVCRNPDKLHAVFYDPMFPEVCKTCDSPLCVGVTIHSAFKLSGNVASPFMTYLDTDVAAYRASGRTNRKLRLKRNLPPSAGQKDTAELRIGYRLGYGDRSMVPDVNDERSGIVQCSVPPCPSGKVENYDFMIDHISSDGEMVFAHYSFELQFNSNGDYTVYFDGCCRPPSIEGLMNNAGLVFHLRAGIQIYADGMLGGAGREYMKRSMKFHMPPMVHLRLQGNAYESPSCTPVCGAGNGQGACTLRFQLQVF